MSNAVGGTITLTVAGERQRAKGSFTYNLGHDKKEAVVGADETHGYKVMPQVPYIEGEITDHQTLDLGTLVDQTDVTVVLELANGKSIVLREGWFAGDGNVSTEEGNITARWEGISAEEI